VRHCVVRSTEHRSVLRRRHVRDVLGLGMGDRVASGAARSTAEISAGCAAEGRSAACVGVSRSRAPMHALAPPFLA
jgi:hypothetical protein